MRYPVKNNCQELVDIRYKRMTNEFNYQRNKNYMFTWVISVAWKSKCYRKINNNQSSPTDHSVLCNIHFYLSLFAGYHFCEILNIE